MQPMSKTAKTYLGIVSLTGVSCLAVGALQWKPENLLQFGFYVLASMMASNLKVILPGITGSMSVNFLFVLVGITELSLPQTLVIGCLSTATQCAMFTKKRPTVPQLAFNISSTAISVTASYALYHNAWLWQRLEGSVTLLLSLATLTYFFVNTLSVTVIVTLTEQKDVWEVWHGSFLWAAPQYLVGGAMAGLIHTLNRFAGWQVAVLVVPVIYFVYRSYRIYLGRLEEETRHVKEMAALHLRSIEALALAIDAKDDTTHDHLRRVQVYATEIAKELGVSNQEVQALEAAALLHDIGKLAVPEQIISKPGRLTPEEFEKMKVHPVVGAEILERVQFPYPVVPIVRHHHEKWNGCGYPAGLKGEEIPLGARILSAVDCLDALASDRQYRRALPLEKALEVVVSEAGKSYDPRVVEILQRRFVELEQKAKNYSENTSKLSTNTRIERGEAPAAGFEKVPSAAERSDASPKVDFLSSIASARQEFQMLLEVTNELGNSLSVDETMSLLAVRLKRMIPHDTIAIYVRQENRLVPQYVNGEDFRLFSSLEIPMGQGLSGWVAENKRPIVNGNPSVEPGYLNDPGKFSKLRSAVSVPLQGMSDTIGALTLYHADAEAFTKDHLRILMAIGSKAGVTIENAMRYCQVESSAVTDELTGLPNARSLFLHLDSELARCKRQNNPLCVLVLDLDGFKQVNDRFGHLQGNKVLQLTAKALRDCCREYDYVARMGGDEFVVIMGGIRRESLSTKTERMVEAVEQVGREINGERLISLSAGEAFFPEDGQDAEQLLAEADRRMYLVKQEHHRQSRLPFALPEMSLPTAIVQ